MCSQYYPRNDSSHHLRHHLNDFSDHHRYCEYDFRFGNRLRIRFVLLTFDRAGHSLADGIDSGSSLQPYVGISASIRHPISDATVTVLSLRVGDH